MLKSLFYKMMIWIDNKIGAAKIFYGLKKISLGKGSCIYSESRIHNFKGNPMNIQLGENTHVRGELMIMGYGGKIEIGDNCFVGENSRIWSGESIKIGSNVLISHNVHIFDTDTHELDHDERAAGFANLIKTGQPTHKGSIKTKPVVIEDNAWLSFNVIVLKGVRIGRGAVLAAGSVVTKDVPEFSVVAGNPAKVIRILKQKNEIH